MTEVVKKDARDPKAKPAYAPREGNNNFARGGRRRPMRRETPAEVEFDQKIIDLARVTRVMAGGKRMRFRACIAIGDHAGKVGIGLAKGVDVTAAINKAVNQAKKSMLDVPIANGTIPHDVAHKFGAARILIKPAKLGKGIICGGVIRVIAELAGIHNMTGKILGTGNNVANAKCTMEALSQLRWTKGVLKAKEEAKNKKAAVKSEVNHGDSRFGKPGEHRFTRPTTQTKNVKKEQAQPASAPKKAEAVKKEETPKEDVSKIAN